MRRHGNQTQQSSNTRPPPQYASKAREARLSPFEIRMKRAQFETRIRNLNLTVPFSF